MGEAGAVHSGDKWQVTLAHSQVYYIGCSSWRSAIQWRKREEGGNGEGRRTWGREEGESKKICVFIQKSPSCPITRLLLTNNTGKAIIYNRTSFLPMFPVSYGFGLTRKTTRIAWHVEFWLSSINSEAQKSHSQVLNLPQTSSEVESGGRDEGGQAKAWVPIQSLISSSRLLGQTSLATANNISVQEKSDHMIKLGIYESPCSIK